VLDWLRVFWTLKNHFTNVFVESFKTLFTAARTCGRDYQHQLGQLVYVLELRPSTLTGHSNKVRRSALDLVVERPAEDDGKTEAKLMTDDELAHAVVLGISDQLGWDTKSTVDWYAFALPNNASDNNLIAVQVRMVT